MKKRDDWIMAILLLVGIITPFAVNFYGELTGSRYIYQYFDSADVSRLAVLNLLSVLATTGSFWILAQRIPFPFSAIPAMTGYFWLFQIYYFILTFETSRAACVHLRAVVYSCISSMVATIVIIVVLSLLMLLLFFVMKKRHECKDSGLTPFPDFRVETEKIPFRLRLIFTSIGYCLLFPLSWIFVEDFFYPVYLFLVRSIVISVSIAIAGFFIPWYITIKNEKRKYL